MPSNSNDTAPADQFVLIVLGRDDTDKPHAATFTMEDAELAAKAADLMGMTAVRLDRAELGDLATSLAVGKVFASGRAFVPFTKAATYERILAAAGITEPTAEQRTASREEQTKAKAAEAGTTVVSLRSVSSGGGRAKGGKANYSAATTWADIKVGSLVLAMETGDDPASWWEAFVEQQRDDDLFILRWAGWPEEDAFIRTRSALGLLPPSAHIST
ncbi:hypothetical protein LMIY3S_05084 [Labrys miyagiensis]